MKSGPLTTVEKTGIQQRIVEGKDIKTIASELDRSEKVIDKYMDGLLRSLIKTHSAEITISPDDNVEPEPQPEPQPVAPAPQPEKTIGDDRRVVPLRTGDLIAKHKTRKGVVSMTPAAAEAGDETRKLYPKKAISDRHQGNLYDVKGNKMTEHHSMIRKDNGK